MRFAELGAFALGGVGSPVLRLKRVVVCVRAGVCNNIFCIDIKIPKSSCVFLGRCPSLPRALLIRLAALSILNLSYAVHLAAE